MLGVLVAVALSCATPALAKKLPKPPKTVWPVAELSALNTHEVFRLKPDPKGRFTQKQLHGWNRFLRCHHTGRTHTMSPRLADLLYQVARHFDFKKVFVVAGYRAPRVAKEKGNPKSPHKKGVACDFRVDGISNTELRDFVRNAFNKVGVGYYPNSDFIHLDVDPIRKRASAFWIDYSGPGERARYSKHPEQDLAAEAPPEPESESEEPGGDEPQTADSPGAPAPNPATAPALTN